MFKYIRGITQNCSGISKEIEKASENQQIAFEEKFWKASGT